MANKPNVLFIVSRDSKELEAKYIRDCLENAGVNVHILDFSIRRSVPGAEIMPEQVAKAVGQTMEQVRALKHEGKCLDVMIGGSVKCAQELHQRIGLSGIIGIGGSMGTTLSSVVMQSFPYGLPKVLISTMASGMTKPFVGAMDIIMVNPVCDIAGLNSITRGVFRQGALAVAAMAHDYKPVIREDKPLVTMTTLGTTDRCTVRIRKSLEDKGYEVMVFHTLGTGGGAMDKINRERDVAVAVDTSLVEVSEHLHGGLCSAGPDRCKAALEKGIPVIFAPGNLDFLVAGPLETDAKVRFPGRRYHIHNAALTAVRAGPEEFHNDAVHLAGLIRDAKGPVAFYVPLLGFSSHDSTEGHLHDPSLPPVFAKYLKEVIPAGVIVKELPYHINDAEFADAIVEQVVAFTKQRNAKK